MARHTEVGPVPASVATAALSVDVRRELGRSRRSVLPRSALAECVAPENRPDPVALLLSQDVSRIPELVPIRYQRMLVSAFTFLRGSALIMASDLSALSDTGLSVQLCGDAHLCNFGLFGSAERRLVFDVNDFDETLPGPWEWDVKRLAASLAVAGRGNGFSVRECERVVRRSVRAYRERMQTLAAMRELDVWYAETCVDSVPDTDVGPPAAAAGTGDRIAIAAYLGHTDAADTAFTRFAEAYAEQNERDYAALREAAKTHQVPTPEAHA